MNTKDYEKKVKEYENQFMKDIDKVFHSLTDSYNNIEQCKENDIAFFAFDTLISESYDKIEKIEEMFFNYFMKLKGISKIELLKRYVTLYDAILEVKEGKHAIEEKQYIREKIKNYVRINGFRFTERKIGIDSTRLNRVVNKADYNPKLRTLKFERILGGTEDQTFLS